MHWGGRERVDQQQHAVVSPRYITFIIQVRSGYRSRQRPSLSSRAVAVATIVVSANQSLCLLLSNWRIRSNVASMRLAQSDLDMPISSMHSTYFELLESRRSRSMDCLAIISVCLAIFSVCLAIFSFCLAICSLTAAMVLEIARTNSLMLS